MRIILSTNLFPSSKKNTVYDEMKESKKEGHDCMINDAERIIIFLITDMLKLKTKNMLTMIT